MFQEQGIAESWERLSDRLDAGGRCAAWASVEPALAGISSVRELAKLTAAGADPDRSDALMGALVRLASASGGDDGDALIVVLHLLRPGVLRIAHRLADLSPDPARLVGGELAARIRAHGRPGPRGGRRERAFAANLLRDTERAVRRELVPHGGTGHGGRREVLVDPTDPGLALLLDRPVPGPELDPPGAPKLVDLMTRAERSKLASPRDLSVLLAAELSRDRHAGAAPQQVIAARLGMTAFSLRRCRARALVGLRAAAGTDTRVPTTGRVNKSVGGVRERRPARTCSGMNPIPPKASLPGTDESNYRGVVEVVPAALPADQVANLVETVAAMHRYLGGELDHLATARTDDGSVHQHALLAGLRQAAAIQRRLATLDPQSFEAGVQVWVRRRIATDAAPSQAGSLVELVRGGRR